MSQHLPLLRYRSNACPICLVCFVCVKVYGEDCLCQPIELNQKSKKGLEYKLDFRNKHITRTGANKQKKKYDSLKNYIMKLLTKGCTNSKEI